MNLKHAILIVIGFLITICCSRKELHEKLLVSDAHLQMGTVWQIKIYAEDTSSAKIIIEEAWHLLDSINALISHYSPDSEISQLGLSSGSGQWLKVHPMTIEILDLSQQMWQASNGAFDITIGPATKIWRRSIDRQELPGRHLIENLTNNIGSQHIEIDKEHRLARLSSSNMSIDLGGIGKGYAVDKIADYLMGRGVNAFLIDGGGDIRIGEAPPQSKGWTIATEQLNTFGQIEIGIDTLSNCSVATSGNKYQHIVSDSIRYQHHIDPQTGFAKSDIYQVTVYSDRCWKADALSTAISILGANEIQGYDFHGFMIKGNDPYEFIEFDASKE